MTKKKTVASVEKIDLHGKTVDEAIPMIEAFLYAAYKAKLTRVWIVHGKGTGTLKQEVIRYLQKHTLVKSYQPADSYKGGHGATVVEM
ncbi:MAG: Smr/MutS family protein [Dehalococcoidales bacterium]|nr:Smr/MutS family protein [Dehalococcoidales bacterium]